MFEPVAQVCSGMDNIYLLMLVVFIAGLIAGAVLADLVSSS